MPDCPHNPVTTDRKLHKLFLRQKINFRKFNSLLFLDFKKNDTSLYTATNLTSSMCWEDLGSEIKTWVVECNVIWLAWYLNLYLIKKWHWYIIQSEYLIMYMWQSSSSMIVRTTQSSLNQEQDVQNISNRNFYDTYYWTFATT